MLSSHVLLYFPLIETTLIWNESLVYHWEVQQHMSRQHKVFCFRICGLMLLSNLLCAHLFCVVCMLSCVVFAVRPFAEKSQVCTWNIRHVHTCHFSSKGRTGNSLPYLVVSFCGCGLLLTLSVAYAWCLTVLLWVLHCLVCAENSNAGRSKEAE